MKVTREEGVLMAKADLDAQPKSGQVLGMIIGIIGVEWVPRVPSLSVEESQRDASVTVVDCSTVVLLNSNSRLPESTTRRCTYVSRLLMRATMRLPRVYDGNNVRVEEKTSRIFG